MFLFVVKIVYLTHGSPVLYMQCMKGLYIRLSLSESELWGSSSTFALSVSGWNVWSCHSSLIPLSRRVSDRFQPQCTNLLSLPLLSCRHLCVTLSFHFCSLEQVRSSIFEFLVWFHSHFQACAFVHEFSPNDFARHSFEELTLLFQVWWYKCKKKKRKQRLIRTYEGKVEET